MNIFEMPKIYFFVYSFDYPAPDRIKNSDARKSLVTSFIYTEFPNFGLTSGSIVKAKYICSVNSQLINNNNKRF